MNKKIVLYSLYFKCRESYVILKDFISFLRKENAVNEYIFNLNHRKTDEDHLTNLFDIDELKWKNTYFKSAYLRSKKSGAFLISSAFQWDDTKEGISFWLDKHHKWYNMFIKKYDN